MSVQNKTFDERLVLHEDEWRKINERVMYGDLNERNQYYYHVTILFAILRLILY